LSARESAPGQKNLPGGGIWGGEHDHGSSGHNAAYGARFSMSAWGLPALRFRTAEMAREAERLFWGRKETVGFQVPQLAKRPFRTPNLTPLTSIYRLDEKVDELQQQVRRHASKSIHS
jgi:hypothetical protein